MLKKLPAYTLIVLAIAGIIFLTFMTPDETTNLSETFRSLLITIESKFGVDPSASWWNSRENVRLLGHVIEYFVLGLTAGFAIKRKLIGLLICMVVSFADQITKIYVPARHFDKGDLLFDIIGVFSGMAIAYVVKFSNNLLRNDEK